MHQTLPFAIAGVVAGVIFAALLLGVMYYLVVYRSSRRDSSSYSPQTPVRVRLQRIRQKILQGLAREIGDASTPTMQQNNNAPASVHRNSVAPTSQ